MSGSIFFWHQFEQHEATCVSKMRVEFRRKSFNHLTNVVDVINQHEALPSTEREWMNNRLEEIAEQFPELISNEN